MIDIPSAIREFLVTNVAAPASGSLEAGITATDTSFSLGSGEGAAFPENENFVVKIEDELFHATRSGDDFTVAPAVEEGRGHFGTDAASHSLGATVYRANLYLIIGTAVSYPSFPAGYENAAPLVMFFDGGGDTNAHVDVHSPRYQMKCLGGSEDPRDAAAVYRALHDRLHKQFMAATGNGMIMSAIEDGIGQLLRDPETEPPWWYVLAAFGFEARAR